MASNQKSREIRYDPKIAQRLWARDATLWSDEEHCISSIQRRLGWLDSPRWLRNQLDDLYRRVSRIHLGGWKRIVLIGMGGSSLAPAVLSRMANTSLISSSYPRLEVLDTTHPGAIRNMQGKGNLAETLFVVSSKSGSTLEVKALWSYIDDQLRQELCDEAHRKNFVAITDEGTPLEILAREKEFLDCFISPADVGGRFSALTYYGMVPAALLGFDLDQISKSAEREAEACQTEINEYNEVLDFGWQIGSHAVDGRNKLTLMLSREIEPIGVWIEQLLAESTGKSGRGIVPIVKEQILPPGSYGKDRIFVAIVLNDDPALMADCRQLELAGVPVFRSQIRNPNDLGSQFFRWEFATAVAGIVLDINPFDEPDVQHTKDATNLFLEGKKTLNSCGLEPCIKENELVFTGDPCHFKGVSNIPAGVTHFFGKVSDGDYVAILSWLEETEEVCALLDQICGQIRQSLRVPAIVNFGPRYLHSTGQLHKGDSNGGIFLQIIGDIETNFPVPNHDYTFSDLYRAQADADFIVLSGLGRRVVRINVGNNTSKGLTKLLAIFNSAF